MYQKWPNNSIPKIQFISWRGGAGGGGGLKEQNPPWLSGPSCTSLAPGPQRQNGDDMSMDKSTHDQSPSFPLHEAILNHKNCDETNHSQIFLCICAPPEPHHGSRPAGQGRRKGRGYGGRKGGRTLPSRLATHSPTAAAVTDRVHWPPLSVHSLAHRVYCIAEVLLHSIQGSQHDGPRLCGCSGGGGGLGSVHISPFAHNIAIQVR